MDSFSEALKGSKLTAQDALRLTIQAMIRVYQRSGIIPRDMEIRQAQIAPHTGLPISEDTVLADLASRYAGYFAPQLAYALGALKVDQPRAIHDLLHSLLEHLSRGLPADDLVICPRSEWHPAPYQHREPAAAEDPGAPYTTASSPVDQVRAGEDSRRAVPPAPGAAPIAQTKASIRGQAKASTPGSGQS